MFSSSSAVLWCVNKWSFFSLFPFYLLFPHSFFCLPLLFFNPFIDFLSIFIFFSGLLIFNIDFNTSFRSFICCMCSCFEMWAFCWFGQWWTQCMQSDCTVMIINIVCIGIIVLCVQCSWSHYWWQWVHMWCMYWHTSPLMYDKQLVHVAYMMFEGHIYCWHIYGISMVNTRYILLFSDWYVQWCWVYM